MYTTYFRLSWHDYQKIAPSHLHSKSHYELDCRQRALSYGSEVMVLMDNVVKVGDWSMVTGWSPQNNAVIDGYIDVRTGKKYSNHESISVAIGN